MEHWPTLTLPPINLWNVPWIERGHSSRVGTQTPSAQRQPRAFIVNSPSHSEIVRLLKLR